MTQVCPKRDAICPHGMDCPYAVDRYTCRREPMAETLRERIASTLAKNNAPSTAKWLYRNADAVYEMLGKAGLIPADEVQARIDSAVPEAVREERERCCRAICKRCATGDVPSPTQAGVWVHQYALGVSDGMQDCDAVELRKEPDYDTG